MRSRVVIGVMLVMLVALASPALVAGRHLSLADEPVATAAAQPPTIIAWRPSRRRDPTLSRPRTGGSSRSGLARWTRSLVQEACLDRPASPCAAMAAIAGTRNSSSFALSDPTVRPRLALTPLRRDNTMT